MSESVKNINCYFRTATKADIDLLLGKIILSERQQTVFEMYYLKKKDVGFISDTLGYCQGVITNELKAIRKKILSSKHIE